MGSVPQETKLGVILFILMTNNPLADWHPRVKFVDDTSVIEMLPRNSISLLNSTVSDIHNFSMDQNMRINPIKFKEMLINSHTITCRQQRYRTCIDLQNSRSIFR